MFLKLNFVVVSLLAQWVIQINILVFSITSSPKKFVIYYYYLLCLQELIKRLLLFLFFFLFLFLFCCALFSFTFLLRLLLCHNLRNINRLENNRIITHYIHKFKQLSCVCDFLFLVNQSYSIKKYAVAFISKATNSVISL